MIMPQHFELDYISAFILGLIQGVTEFLPVSSSGHLAMMRHLGIGKIGQIHPPLVFDLILHLATILVVLKAFWKDIAKIIRHERVLLLYLAFATVPAAICGFFFRDYISSLRDNPMAVCCGLLCTSGFLFICQRVNYSNIKPTELGLLKTITIGICQAFALVPGISRSGMTITGGVMCGLTRADSIRFSFLLMIPIVTGAFAAESIKDYENFSHIPLGPAILGFAVAAITGYIALKILTFAVLRFRLNIFAWYCAFLGLSGLIYFSLQ